MRIIPTMIMPAKNQVPDPIVGTDIDVITNLVQTHPFMLNDAVVQLEDAASKQDTSNPPFQPERISAVKIGKHERGSDGGEPAERVKQSIGDKADIGCRFIIEMMPVQRIDETQPHR